MTAAVARSRRRALLEMSALVAEAALVAMAIWFPTGFLFGSPQPETAPAALQTALLLLLLVGGLMVGAWGFLRALAESGRARALGSGAALVAAALALGWAVRTLDGLAPAEGRGGVGLWIYAGLWAAVLVWRAAGSQRDLSRQGVASAFRVGMLLALLLGASLAYGLPPESPPEARLPRQVAALLLFWSFLSLALATLQLSRLHDTTLLGEGGRDGAPVYAARLPWRRAVPLLLPAALLPALGGLLALVWSPAGFGLLGRVLAPVGRLMGFALSFVVAGLFWLLSPLVQWLEALSRQMQGEDDVVEVLPTPVPGSSLELSDLAAGDSARPYLLIVLGIALAIVILIVLRRTLKSLREGEAEEALPAVDWGPPEPPAPAELESAPKPELTPTELLAASSVRNLYANVSRLAARRGSPRPADVAPDLWLPTLRSLFPGGDPALEAITFAYMRVHYGDIPTDPAELERLRAAWESLRARWE